MQTYLDDFIDVGNFGCSKLATIKALINRPDLADIDAMNLRRSDILDYLRRRLKEAKPQTMKNDIMWLSVAFKTIAASREWPIAADEVSAALDVASQTKMAKKAEQRDRRPTLEELEQIIELSERGYRKKMPLDELVLFAIFSASRQEEIAKLRWDGLDREKKRILVPEAKDPVRPMSYWAHIPDEALAVIERQPKTDARIFPYVSKAISARFTQATSLLGIEDLRFHDLRHEAASYWFERGLQIRRVAQITGHRSWGTLKRYTHLYDFDEQDKYAGWRYRPLGK
nr:site-specific integrase [Microbulbifer sp. CAU 1566]